MDVLSLAAGFLAGAAITYLVSYFMKPSGSEVASTNIASLSNQLWQAHEKLLKEIKQDLENPDFKFHREFYVMKKGWDWSRWGFHRKGPRLAYFLEDHDNLLQQLDTLVSQGLISNEGEAEKGTVKYRLNEKFVESLRNKQI